MPVKTDVSIIRELAAQVADIAAMDVHEEKRRLWRGLNARSPQRPMVMIDQVCWNEMDVEGALTLRCENKECRRYEEMLRRTLLQWKHFPVDMVVEPFVRVPKAVVNTGLGIQIQQDVAVTDPTNSVVGHRYVNQFVTDEDIERIQTPRVSHDHAETRRRLDVAGELFDGLLEVRPWGVEPYLTLWDPLAMWMGVEAALYALVDRPDYMHRLLGRMTDAQLAMLDQLEQQGLLCGPQSVIHCTGAHTDELPADGYDPSRPRMRDMWTYGMAQMLGTVSPAMFQEFEIDYFGRICRHFGLVYYGCCEGLDRKMDQVRRLANVRKVSVSPWADQQRAAAEIGGEFIYSRKPSPAMLAGERFDADAVRADLTATRELCRRHGCGLELILKDISTVRYQPQRLFEWARVAMEVACS